MKCSIVPYIEIDGIRTISDSQLNRLYDKIVEENALHILFPNGAVKEFEEFLYTFKDSSHLHYILFDESTNDIIGLVSLTNFYYNTAYVSVVVFKQYYGKAGLQACKQFLNFLFENKIVHCLYGLVSVNNKLIQRWLTKLPAVYLHTIKEALFNYYENDNEDALLYMIPMGVY